MIRYFLHKGNKYVCIDTLNTCQGRYELYESVRYGVDVPDIVVKDGEYIDSTFDGLWEWYHDTCE